MTPIIVSVLRLFCYFLGYESLGFTFPSYSPELESYRLKMITEFLMYLPGSWDFKMSTKYDKAHDEL